MKGRASLSVIIPVYNEAELVDRSVRYIDSFLSRNFTDYEIIIVESGSTDGSGDACDRLAAELRTVAVIHEGRRNGFGHAPEGASQRFPGSGAGRLAGGPGGRAAFAAQA